MRITLFTILILLCVNGLFAHKRIILKAEADYEFENYHEAILNYKKVSPVTLSNEQKWHFAEALHRVKNYYESLYIYEQIDLKALNEPQAYYNFAEVLENNNQFTEAKRYYKLYQSINPNDTRVEEKLHLVSEFHLAPIQNVNVSQTTFNTSKNDFVGFMLRDELVIVSSGVEKSRNVYLGDGQPFLTFYNYDEKTDKLVHHTFGKEHGKEAHDGPGFFDTITNELFFTRNAKIHENRLARGKLSNLKVYRTQLQGDKWIAPEELSWNDDDYSYGHPTGLSGADFLIFASDREGGYGDADLYMIHRHLNEWSEPVNLGKIINTQGKEMFPYLRNDSTLYFASDGHEGYGGLDLFEAIIVDGKVKQLNNLGALFNTSKDDFGIVFSDPIRFEGYFASDRIGNGQSDVYFFNKGDIPVIVKVITENGTPCTAQKLTKRVDRGNSFDFVTDNKGFVKLYLSPNEKGYLSATKKNYSTTTKPYRNQQANDTIVLKLFPEAGKQNMNITVKDLSTDEVVEGVKVTLTAPGFYKEVLTNEQGKIDEIVPSDIPYKIATYKDGYIKRTLELPQSQSNHEVKIQPKKVNTLISLQKIYYEYDKDRITQESKLILDELFQILEDNPTIEIEINSHADVRGNLEYNEDLSLRRAKAVVAYLRAKGINPDRLSIKYYGERRPDYDCPDEDCSEEEHYRNRRTEFRIIKH